MRGKNRKIKLEQVYNRKNVELAAINSQKNKKGNYGVNKFNKNFDENIDKICKELKNRTYKTSKPKFEKRFCVNKWRVLAKVMYYDNVVEHALMQVINPILLTSYYYESAASIKGRGVKYMVEHVNKYISLNIDKKIYAAEGDFVKCYHHVVREKLYKKVCKEFNDDGIRWLLHDIIYALGNHNGLCKSDGKTGVGLGLYPITGLVNFYFNDLDRFLESIPGIKVFRYLDNILMIAFSPEDLQRGIEALENYAKNVLEQPVHTNIGIQEITETHGILYIGRRFFKGFVEISNETKYRIKRKDKKYKDNKEQWRKVMASYKGVLQHINGLNLWRKITGMNKFSDFNIKRPEGKTRNINGKRFFDVTFVSCEALTDKSIVIEDFEENCETKNGSGRTFVLVNDNGKSCKFCTNSPDLKSCLKEIKEKNGLPFETTIKYDIVNNIKNYKFT